MREEIAALLQKNAFTQRKKISRSLILLFFLFKQA